MKIYLIDDEESIRIGVGDDLRDLGHSVLDFGNPLSALEIIQKEEPDCVLCDLKMPEMNGFDVLKKIRELNPHIIVIIITAFGEVSTAVQCLKEGAFDYITKPFKMEDVEKALEKARAFVELKHANLMLKQALAEKHSYNKIIGKSKAMQKVFQQIEVISQTDGTVLIEGETGTGKELVAEAIHYDSLRKDGPLIKFSCAIFNKELLESELFGHEKGAFTGAIKQKKGRFELAHGGTIFLDEVDDIPVETQVKFLRFLQDRTFERIGGEKTLEADVRIIAATKTNLLKLVEENHFRSDLYYRINVLPVFLPPLREREGDIPLLVNHFLNKYAQDKSMEIKPEAIQILNDYEWPGNIRQIEHIIERLAYTIPGKVINKEHIPDEIKKDHVNPLHIKTELSFDQAIDDIERGLLERALKETKGNKKRAAKNLQLPYSTFRHKLDKFNIS